MSVHKCILSISKNHSTETVNSIVTVSNNKTKLWDDYNFVRVYFCNVDTSIHVNLHAECTVLVLWNCDQALLRDAAIDLVRLNDLQCSSYFYLLIMYIQQVHEQWHRQDSKGAWGR